MPSIVLPAEHRQLTASAFEAHALTQAHAGNFRSPRTGMHGSIRNDIGICESVVLDGPLHRFRAKVQNSDDARDRLKRFIDGDRTGNADEPS